MAPFSQLISSSWRILAIFFFDTRLYAYAFEYVPPPPPPATRVSRHHTGTVFPSLAISDANLPGLPELRTQNQQVQAALPLGGTIRGTKWRVREERGESMSPTTKDGKTASTFFCTSTVTFQGFDDEPNRGTVEYDQGTCDNGDEGGGKGLRWVGKTTRVVQLTARWKVRLPQGKFIYKGYIDGGRRRQIEGRGGSNSAEMTGVILTGEDSSDNPRIVGKFTADLIQKFE